MVRENLQLHCWVPGVFVAGFEMELLSGINDCGWDSVVDYLSSNEMGIL